MNKVMKKDNMIVQKAAWILLGLLLVFSCQMVFAATEGSLAQTITDMETKVDSLMRIVGLGGVVWGFIQAITRGSPMLFVGTLTTGVGGVVMLNYVKTNFTMLI